ncbi:ATP-binding protein [Litoribrevibacter euphylliae]|uniref:histidine kinase n=1 Tax=Litoribrevibacter euphylliae TaxID=1834034 RepID=A0ABV7HJT6_9GAMM
MLLTRLQNYLERLLPAEGISFHRLIAASLCLSLGITASVCLWFYYQDTNAVLKEGANEYSLKLQRLTSLELDHLKKDMGHIVSMIQHDPRLMMYAHQQSQPFSKGHSNESSSTPLTEQQQARTAIQQRLNELIIQYSTDLDILLFLPIRDGQEIIAGHSQYKLDQLISTVRNFIPNTGAVLFSPGTHDPNDEANRSAASSDTPQAITKLATHDLASGIAYGTELVGGKYNKRLGFLFGITLFNNNTQLLRNILNTTEADGAAFVLGPGVAQATQHQRIRTLASLNLTLASDAVTALQLMDVLTNEHVTQVALSPSIHYQSLQQDRHQNNQLQLLLWQDEPYVSSHQQRFQRTLIIVVTLVLSIGLGLSLLATRISSRSLRYLTQFADKQTNGATAPDFQTTPILEINHVGHRLEQAIQDLASNEEMYRNILNNSGSVVYIKSLDGRYQFVNTEFECVTGMSLKQVQGKTNEEIFPEAVAKELTNNDQRVIEESRVLNFREDLIKDNETFSFLTVKFPIKDRHGQLIYVGGFSTDITGIIQAQKELSHEKARAEEATTQLNALNKSLADAITKKTMELESAQESLVQSEKLASLGSLVAGISHELNTPIGTALTVTTTLEEHVHQLNDDFQSGSLRKRAMENYLLDLQESASILNRSLTAAIELISSFKQLSVDQTSAQRRTFSLKKTLDEVAITHRHLLSDSPIQLLAMVDQDANMDSYPGALVQVLNNLIQNAFNHGFGKDHAGTIVITAKPVSDQIVITVSDNGHGIPLNFQKKVFDPFFTTKLGQGGSGLGLHIVHSIVTGILGGNITLNSRYGGVNSGTDFKIEIPLIAPCHQDKTTPVSLDYQ